MRAVAPLGDKENHRQFVKMVQDILSQRTIPWDDELTSLWGEMERQGYTRGRYVDGWKVLAAGKERFGDDLQTLFQMPCIVFLLDTFPQF